MTHKHAVNIANRLCHPIQRIRKMVPKDWTIEGAELENALKELANVVSYLLAVTPRGGEDVDVN